MDWHIRTHRCGFGHYPSSSSQQVYGQSHIQACSCPFQMCKCSHMSLTAATFRFHSQFLLLCSSLSYISFPPRALPSDFRRLSRLKRLCRKSRLRCTRQSCEVRDLYCSPRPGLACRDLFFGWISGLIIGERARHPLLKSLQHFHLLRFQIPSLWVPANMTQNHEMCSGRH
jgi:hypothetical protein